MDMKATIARGLASDLEVDAARRFEWDLGASVSEALSLGRSLLERSE
jgi:hypothetical protein